MIILIEGPRNTGKTFLLDLLDKGIFKFPFSDWFNSLKISDQSEELHSFALAKEIMLHQLNRDGYLQDKVFVDRGIITTWVWGLMQGRITRERISEEMDEFIKNGLFNDVKIILFEGKNLNKRREEKDFWDNSKYQEESDLYLEIIREITRKVDTTLSLYPFSNDFDKKSGERFIAMINKIENG